MRHLFNDPLVHFLAAGALLFAVASALSPAEQDEKTITVDRAGILQFIQYRSKAFEPATAALLLDRMTEKERAALVRDYVREEALAREATTLGLDANDYVIRQRMVQKVEFLAEAAAAAREPTEEEIKAFYDANRERYASPPAATMTHVFVSTEQKTAEAAQAEALSLLERLRAAKAGYNGTSGLGDRFMFHRNYVDRTDDYIFSQLGPDIAAAIFSPDTPLNEWVGPYRSQYGAHLLFIASRAPARLAPLEEIHDLVRSDLAEDMRQIAIDAAIEEIVSTYQVDDRLSGGE